MTARGALRRDGDGWLPVGLLGALLGLSLVFVHVPAAIWAGNTAEFHWRFGTYLQLGVAALAAGLLLAAAALWLLPRGARPWGAGLICAAGVAAWVYGALLSGTMPPLDGTPLALNSRLGVWELPLAGLLWVVCAVFVVRARRPAVVALLALNAGLVVATTASVQSAAAHRVRAPAGDDRALELFRFSPRENVLVILLDGLQAQVVADVFQDDAELQDAFEGFRFYRDTLGVAPTTFISLPAIHSGIAYRRRNSIDVYFEEAIRLRSFMSRFADAGYHTALVNPIEGLCPEGVAVCTTSDQVLRTSGAQLWSESLRLLDLALFRLAPFRLKAAIYDAGSWFLADHFDQSEEIRRIVEHNLLLSEMGRRLVVEDAAPTLKFVHSLATHTPFVLNEDCRTLGESSIEQLWPQARCALAAVAALLDALKTAGIYDRTEILIVADHGIGVADRRRYFGTEAERAWARMAGYANPTFLLKPRGARGRLAHDDAEVHLVDVGATLCASSGACTAPRGIPAGRAPAGRPRRFLQHEWRHEYWLQRAIPLVSAYEVRGPLWEPGSWAMIGEPRDAGR